MAIEQRAAPRALLLLPGGFALLAGLNAGLLLLGLPAPVDTVRLTEVHGVLLVLGFVGTVVALERAVAARRMWCYLAPGCLGVGAVLLTTPMPRLFADVLLIAGCALLVAIYLRLWRRAADLAVVIQAAGAVLATGAALLWSAGLPVFDLLPWLAGFLILTIAGERLELARVAMLGTRADAAIGATAGAVVAATVAALLWPTAGYALLGAALVALTVALLVFDIARRTVRGTGLTRYIAVCLLAGYGWLLVPGITWLLIGQVQSGNAYDAVVHAVMLGFVLSMIMAHAPVILPAVLRRPLPYTPLMYGPVLLLHLSLALRVLVGDVRGVEWAVTSGGALNVAAVLAFIAIAVYSALRLPEPTPKPTPQRVPA